MQTFELLDKFELLYPTNSKLADLRRAYIDQDISSIFRLTNADDELRKAITEQNLHSIFRVVDDCDTEELRKAVIEQNLHSIFRLVNDDDLRKLVLEDNTWKLWPILDRYVDTQFVAAFKNFFVNDTEIWNDCFSRGQLQSKMWLVSELEKLDIDLGTVFLCAGWYATLAVMLFESKIKVDKIRSFDIEPTCVDIAEVFNAPWFKNKWQFKSITQDIMDINYEEHTWQSWSNANNRMSYLIVDTPDTIINTSCEHIANFEEWYVKIPDGKLVVLQSNNYYEVDEHVNCSVDLDDFSRQTLMSSTLYEGELQLEKYTRFMKIGYK
jgi:hypothetical protein